MILKYEFRGRNIDINDMVKERSMKRLARLSKFVPPDTCVSVTYRAERNDVVCEITIPMPGIAVLRAEARDEGKFNALDAAIDKLERQIVRYRKKLIDRYQADERPSFFSGHDDAEEVPDVNEIENMVISRIKTISAKPMDPVEACLQMELSGHDFFAFKNTESMRVNIVYRRKEEGTYGLIDIAD